MADDYAARFDELTSLVPTSSRMTSANQLLKLEYYGEVLSGSPIIPLPREEPARTTAKLLISNTVFANDDSFKTLSNGLTHKRFMTEWPTGSLLTSCNSFVGYVTGKFGYGVLGDFNLEKILQRIGKSHCWITPSSGETPQYGDVFETRSITPGAGHENLHIGFSLAVEGTVWKTLEGGQGGPVAGYDKIARIKKPYNTTHLLGWVDMRLLIAGTKAVPLWLVGTWMVTIAGKPFVYTIDRGGTVKHKAYVPIGQTETVPDLDDGTIFSVSGDTVKVNWKTKIGLETLIYDRFNSFPGINERLKGETYDHRPLTGVRL